VVRRDQALASAGLEPTAVWALHWVDRERIAAGYTDIFGVHSNDGGRSWRFAGAGPRFNTIYDLVRDGPRLYAAASQVHDLYMSTYLTDAKIEGSYRRASRDDPPCGAVLASEDAGASWRIVAEFPGPVFDLESDASRAGRLYAAVSHRDQGGIYVTDVAPRIDRPESWRRLEEPPRTEGRPGGVFAVREGLVAWYSGRRHLNEFTPSSGFFVSDDGGRTWDDRTPQALRRWLKSVSFDPHDLRRKTWFACVHHHWGRNPGARQAGLYRTRDRGASWDLLLGSDAMPSGLCNTEHLAISPTERGVAFLSTADDGLWFTTTLHEDRPTFVPVASYGFAHPLRVFFSPHDPDEVWVGSFGNGLCHGRLVRSVNRLEERR
jgi:hypothetical protein